MRARPACTTCPDRQPKQGPYLGALSFICGRLFKAVKFRQALRQACLRAGLRLLYLYSIGHQRVDTARIVQRFNNR